MPITEVNRSDVQDNTVVSIGENGSTDLADISAKKNGTIGLEVLSEHTLHSYNNFDGKKYFIEDMSLVARNTSITSTFTDIFSYTGVGSLIHFSATLETGDTDWYTRIIVDSTYYPLFGTTGAFHPDLKGGALYNVFTQDAAGVIGLGLSNDTIIFNPKSPLKFASTLKIQVRHLTGKRFRAGFITLIKD